MTGETKHTHGSTATSYDDPLDQERASSMADEGGVAGARQDALEQRRGAVEAREVDRRGPLERAGRKLVAFVIGRFFRRR